MHLKSDNIEITINDDADEVIEEILKSNSNRYQKKPWWKVVSFTSITFIYCILNAIK